MGFQYGPGTAQNILSVPGGWQIMYDSGAGIEEANPETGPQATVQFHVKSAADRYSFVQQLLGYSTGTPPANILYTGPYVYPPSPNLLCTAVTSVKALGKFTPNLIGLPWFFGSGAVVTAVFTRPQWQAQTNAGYFTINYQAGGDSITLPNTTYQFADGTPTSSPIGLIVAHQNIVVTRYRMPFLPDQYAMPILNTVNNAPFTIGWNTYAAGTLLFTGINNDITPDPFGNIIFTVAYIFQFRAVPWNYAFHPNRTTGWAIVTDGNGNPTYASANFNILP